MHKSTHNHSFCLNRSRLGFKEPYLLNFADDQTTSKEQTTEKLLSGTNSEILEKRRNALLLRFDKSGTKLSGKVKKAINPVLKDEDVEPELLDIIENYLTNTSGTSDRVFLKTLRKKQLELAEKALTTPIKSVPGSTEEVKMKIDQLLAATDALPVSPHNAHAKDQARQAKILNRIDRVKTDEMVDLVAENPELNLSSNDWQKIFNLNPHSESYKADLGKILGESFCQNNQDFVRNFAQLQEEKADAANKFEELTTEIFAQLEQEQREEYHKKIKLKELNQATGLPIKKGQVFKYKNEQGKTGVVEVKEIHWENPIDDTDLEIALRDQAGKIYQEPVVEIETRSNGITKKQKLGFRKCLEWFKLHNEVTEFMPTFADMHKSLELDQYDQKLAKGDKLEYQVGLEEDRRLVITENIEIIDIDETTGEIELSKPVNIVLNDEDAATATRKTADHKHRLNFAEFVRFWRCRGVEQQMDIKTAQNVLNKLSDKLKTEYGVGKGIPETPIKLEPGFKIDNGLKGYTAIKEVSDEKIELSNGQKMPLSQFIQLAKTYEYAPYVDSQIKPQEGTVPHEVAEPEKVEQSEEQTPEPLINQPIDTASTPPNEPSADATIEEAQKPEEEAAPSPPTPEQPPLIQGGTGFFRSIWNSVTFLSFNNIYHMGEVTYEFYKRNWDRNSKRRTGDAGSTLPGPLGREFQNMAQGSEIEAVNKFKEGLEEMSDWVITDRLYASSNRDEVKAYLITLTDRGILRFEDPRLWIVMNRLLDQIPGGQYSKIPISTYKDRPEEALDYVKKSMDTMWGNNTGDNFYKTNTSKWDSESSSFNQEAQDYENQYKGIGLDGELHKMLTDFKNGEPVKPQRYYAFLKFIMEQGKAAVEDKFYYLIMGLYIKNPRGETLLPKRVVASLNVFSNQLPFLDFFTRCRPFTGQGTMPPDYLADLVDAFGMYDQKKDGKRYNSDAINQYIWQDTMMLSATQTRVSKGSRGSGKIDHDDSHFIIPFNALGDLRQNVLGKEAGDRPNYTKDGLKNGVAGFSQVFAAVSATPTEKESAARIKNGFVPADQMLLRMVPSYLYYMAALTGKIATVKTGHGPEFLDEKAGVDGELTMGKYFEELNEIMAEILKEYGYSDEDIKLFANPGVVYAQTDSENYRKDSDRIENFSVNFSKRVKADDGGQKIVDIIRRAARSGKISGITGLGKTVATQKTFANYWNSGYSGKPAE